MIVVADSGNWDAKTPALTVSLRGNTRFTLRVRTLDARVALRDVRGSGARRDDGDGEAARDRCGTRTAPSPSKDSTERDAETPAYSEETLRDEAGPAGGCQPDRPRHDPQPHLEQAVASP